MPPLRISASTPASLCYYYEMYHLAKILVGVYFVSQFSWGSCPTLLYGVDRPWQPAKITLLMLWFELSGSYGLTKLCKKSCYSSWSRDWWTVCQIVICDTSWFIKSYGSYGSTRLCRSISFNLWWFLICSELILSCASDLRGENNWLCVHKSGG
jgi:hypothetical protein